MPIWTRWLLRFASIALGLCCVAESLASEGACSEAKRTVVQDGGLRLAPDIYILAIRVSLKTARQLPRRQPAALQPSLQPPDRRP